MTPIIYVAAPYRADTEYGLLANVRRAERLSVAVAQAGGYPVAPHACTAFFGGLQPDTFWLDATLRLMRKCDGVLAFRRPGEEFSAGVKAEWEEALRLGIPCRQVCYEDNFREMAEVLIGKAKAMFAGSGDEQFTLAPPAD